MTIEDGGNENDGLASGKLSDKPMPVELELERPEVKQVRARNKARRRTYTATCPTCGAEHDFNSARDADAALREWKRKQ